MLRSIFSGISGMRNQQDRIDVIGNNLANVNTVGFKAGRVNFHDQFSQTLSSATAPTGGRGGVNGQQVGLGMSVASIDTLHTQGNLQSTGKSTDVAIEGDGFFVMSDGANRLYTRAGDFDFDREGKLVDPASGLHVMGWGSQQTTDANGVVSNTINHSAPVSELAIPAGLTLPPTKTTSLEIKGNLDATTPLTATASTPNYYESTSQVFDNQGNAHQVAVRYTRSGANSWNWSISSPGTTVSQADANNAPKSLTFDSQGLLTGTLTSPPTPFAGGSWDLTWSLPDGSTSSTTITPNFGNQQEASHLTQFASLSTAVVADQNGAANGVLTGVSIDRQGIVNGVFSNGKQQPLAQIAVATFTNPGGLTKQGDNTFVRSTNSGDAVINTPSQGGAGVIAAGNLESSNVDLTSEFSNLIITQRGFQASSKVITTSDELLQELINLKR